MAEDLTDEEQAERIKQWWRDNGVSVVISVVVAVAAVLGWQQWQSYQQKTAASASVVYERMTNALSDVSAGSDQAGQEVRKAADTLMSEHEGTIYADFAALTLARLAVQDGDLDAAAAELTKVVDSPAQAPLGHVARIRLARVELERERYERVAELLQQKLPGPWQGRALELKGDMRLAQDDREGAREAYSSALDALESGDRNRNRVEMKLNDLAVSS